MKFSYCQQTTKNVVIITYILLFPSTWVAWISSGHSKRKKLKQNRHPLIKTWLLHTADGQKLHRRFSPFKRMQDSDSSLRCQNPLCALCARCFDQTSSLLCWLTSCIGKAFRYPPKHIWQRHFSINNICREKGWQWAPSISVINVFSPSSATFDQSVYSEKAEK